MKNLIFTLFAAMTMTACAPSEPDDSIIWDFANHDIVIVVKDAEGNNLSDPAFYGNILTDGVTVEFRGKVYPLTEPAIPTRENAAYWYGFRPDTFAGVPVLMFGEFQPDGYRNEELTINWGDGSTDVLNFDCYVKWTSKNNPDVVLRISQQGGQTVDGSLKIELTR